MRKKTLRILFGLCIFVLLIIFLTVFLYTSFHPITQQILPLDVTIGEPLSINLDDDALHFGTLNPGSSSQRSILLRAEHYAVAITLHVQGVPFVFPEKDSLLLQRGEQEIVRMYAVTDILTPRKHYEGALVITTKKL